MSTRKELFAAAYGAVQALQDADVEAIGKATALILLLREFLRKTRNQKVIADISGVVAGGAILANELNGMAKGLVVTAIAIATAVLAIFKNISTVAEEREKLAEVQEDIKNLLQERHGRILHLIQTLAPVGIDLDDNERPIQQGIGNQSRLLATGVNVAGAAYSLFDSLISSGEQVNVEGGGDDATGILAQFLENPGHALQNLTTEANSIFNDEITRRLVIVGGSGIIFVNFYQLLVDLGYPGNCPVVRRLQCVARELQWEIEGLNTIRHHLNKKERQLILEETAEIEGRIKAIQLETGGRVSLSLSARNLN